MVHRFNNIRTDLGIGTMPEENIVYSRKGGCFVSLCKGVCVTILLIIIISLLLVIVFFSTKHAYEKNAGVTLEEYVKKPSPFIDKIDKMAKLFNPKTYRLIIQPIFNETDNSFTFKGTVFIVVAARRGNNKKIELNVKNLIINENDVLVYKSFKIPNLKNENLFSIFDNNYNNNNDNYLRAKRNDLYDEIIVNDDDGLLHDNDDNETITSTERINISDELIDTTTINISDDDLITSTEYKILNNSQPFPTTKKCDEDFNDDDDYDDEWAMKKVNKIDYDEDDDKMIISLDVELRRNIFYTVKIKFSGNMTNNRGLFYKTFIDKSGDTRYLAATYTTPESARLIFPCFDDDDFQSTFDLSIIRPNKMKSASNAPINNTEILNDDLMIDNYYLTPPIPASELGFVVTDIKSNSLEINNNLSVQLFTQEENINNLEYIMLTIQNVANILENYTNVPFNMNELSYVIVPHRHNNYREIKRGIIFTSESIIPISNDDQMILDFNEITHEMALQWFDGINQYELDEEIWLRSAFPLFLQQVTLSEIESSFYESLYLTTKSEIMKDEMRYYKFKLTRETDDDRLNQEIITLMKNKGLCILKMFNSSFSEGVFRAAIREYFRKRTHNQTVEFYTTLQDALSNLTNIKYDINILEVFDQWINYERYPVITVTRNLSSNQFILSQRWMGFAEEKNIEIWHIPVTYITSLHDNILNRTFWMTKKKQCIEIENQSNNIAFILLNPSGIGYYRANYDEITWNNLINLLRNHHSDFTQLSRAVLVDDAFNLARYNLLDYKIVFRLVSCLKKQEQTYTTWRAILDNFEFIIDNMPTNELFYVQEYIIDLIDHIHNTLINASDEVNETITFDENTNLRNLIRKWACKLGNKVCIDNMRQKLNMLNEKSLWDQRKSKDELYLILCTVITYGGYDDWITIEGHFNKSMADPTVIIEALGCTREPSLIAKYINFLMANDLNKQKYANNILNAISKNRIMFKFVMEFLFDYWKDISIRYELKQLAIIFKRISTDNDFQMLQNIFSKYSHTFDDRDKDIFKHILHCIKTTLKWRSEIANKITKNMFIISDNKF